MPRAMAAVAICAALSRHSGESQNPDVTALSLVFPPSVDRPSSSSYLHKLEARGNGGPCKRKEDRILAFARMTIIRRLSALPRPKVSFGEDRHHASNV